MDEIWKAYLQKAFRVSRVTDLTAEQLQELYLQMDIDIDFLNQ